MTFPTPNSGDFHDEVSLGSLVQVPGFPDVVVTIFDPIPRSVGSDEWPHSGLRWFNNTSGASSKAFRLIIRDFDDCITFAKANGLGNLVALCDAAPIEIGNHVWVDANGNSVQDRDEIYQVPGVWQIEVLAQDMAVKHHCEPPYLAWKVLFARVQSGAY